MGHSRLLALLPVQERAQEGVGITAEVGTRGDHGEDGLGGGRVKAGEVGAEFAVPDALEDGDDFGGLTGAMREGFSQDRQGGFIISACRVGECAEGDHGKDGLGDFGVEAGKVVAEFAVPAALEDGGDFARLSGLEAEDFVENRQGGH